MDLDNALRILYERLAELKNLPADPESQEFLDWRERAILAMDRIFGPYRVRSISRVTFRSKSLDPNAAFETGRRRAEAVLKGAIFQLEELLEPPDFTSGAWADPDLWEHVRYHVQDEQWAQVASQTSIFVESRSVSGQGCRRASTARTSWPRCSNPAWACPARENPGRA
jgi:hypothetical protein